MGGKRSIISLIIVCLIGCMLCGCDKKQDTEKEIGKNAPKIVVGSDNYPPFNYIDENGKPTVLMLILLPRLLKDWATVSNL